MSYSEIKNNSRKNTALAVTAFALLAFFAVPFKSAPLSALAAQDGAYASGNKNISTNPDYADVIFGTDKMTGDRTMATPPGQDVQSYDQRYNFTPDWNVEVHAWPSQWNGLGPKPRYSGAGMAPSGQAISPKPEVGIPSRPAPIGALPGSGNPPPRMPERPSFRPQPGTMSGGDSRPTPGRAAGESYRPMPGRIPGDY